MNCKPNQRVLVVRGCRMEPCAALALGLPTKTANLHQVDNMIDALRDLYDGPSWNLAEPLHCPRRRSGCPGIEHLPDKCLRPFDPESEPAQDEADTGVDIPTTEVNHDPA